jgi:hypothetical protein
MEIHNIQTGFGPCGLRTDVSSMSEGEKAPQMYSPATPFCITSYQPKSIFLPVSAYVLMAPPLMANISAVCAS